MNWQIKKNQYAMLRRAMARLYPPPEIKFPAKFIN